MPPSVRTEDVRDVLMEINQQSTAIHAKGHKFLKDGAIDAQEHAELTADASGLGALLAQRCHLRRVS